jgi:N6-L-threonylcarbamoyladenine synthase
LVGASFAKAFALALGKPLLEVNHMQAHILSHFIEDSIKRDRPKFPFLCLTVSGGHTQLVRVDDFKTFSIIGQTIDDAAGETFDKTAKILGLPYPGGPLVDKLAKEGNSKAFKFPIAQIPGMDFSFSGLKTAILYFVRDELKKDSTFLEKQMANICASVQYTIVKTLLDRVEIVMKQTGINQIALAGGVSANTELRASIQELGKKNNWSVFIPPIEYCTDNAAMIAMNGYLKFLENNFVGQDIAPSARLQL